MTDAVAGLPEGVASLDLVDGRVSVDVDDKLYPLEAVYAAAYVFIDRCYVLLDRPSQGAIRVTLASKTESATTETLRAHLGEFLNELLSGAYRAQLTRDNRAVLEMITSQALSGAMGPPSLDELASLDFSDPAAFEDPLGIAMSWEEKYKKKKQGEGAAPEEGKAEDGEGGSKA